MTAKTILTFNPGSSTIKLGFFQITEAKPVRLLKGVIDFHTTPAVLSIEHRSEKHSFPLDGTESSELTEILRQVFHRLAAYVDFDHITAVGHRVVHGGDRFSGPAAIDDQVIAAIESMTEFAPLHQPESVRLIRAVQRINPALPQVASFDTAFHRSIDDTMRRFAIPRALHDQGIKRYGFHGLSYKSIMGQLDKIAPRIADGKVIVAHLGSGASLCAIKDGKSRNTTMGFSTLDGVPMATRCGAIDPGVLLHLLESGKYDAADLTDMLYNRSGLLGISGFSPDSRELLKSDRPEAKQAIDVFTFHIAEQVSRLATAIGGLDALVFTAGIGENQARIRADVCAHLQWMGLKVAPDENAANATVISTDESRATILVVATDEEQAIAEEALAVIRRRDS